MTTLEICCADLRSVKAAIEGGAHRIELCSALEVGGLTPSTAFVEAAVNLCTESGVKLHILIRPRPGDYLYSPEEVEIMELDINYSIDMGADGVVIGALNPDGTVDVPTITRLVNLARFDGISTTFHRAFDLCRDPFEAMQTIASMGIDRILTSGGAPSASRGRALIAELVKKAPDGLSILAGAGITSANAAAILKATGITELHSSAKKRIDSDMTFRHEGVSMGATGNDEYSRFTTDASEVAAIINSLNQL